MGVYYNLICKKCRCDIHFGKKLWQGDQRVLEGMFSEREPEGSITDVRCWLAIQRFLLQHVNHPLLFGPDEESEDEESIYNTGDYERVEFDDLVPPSSG